MDRPMTDSEHTYRLSSSLFKKLPWADPLVLAEKNELLEFAVRHPEFEPLINGVFRFEDRLRDKSQGTQAADDYFRWWTDNNADDFSLSGIPQGYFDQGHALTITYLLTHRVLDVGSYIHQQPGQSNQQVLLARNQEPFLIEQRDKKISSLKKALIGKKGPDNWVSMVFNARQALEGIWAAEVDKTEENPPHSVKEDDVGAHIFQSVVENTKKAKGYSIIVNIETAALHMHVLLKRGVMDIPDIMNLAREFGAPGDLQDIERSHKKSDFQKALFVSLAVSPVWLLMDSLLSSKTIAKSDLFDVWSCSAFPRSDELMKLEKALWKSLFSISAGTPTRESLQRFFQEIDLLDISEGAESPGSSFFRAAGITRLDSNLLQGVRQKDNVSPIRRSDNVTSVKNTRSNRPTDINVSRLGVPEKRRIPPTFSPNPSNNKRIKLTDDQLFNELGKTVRNVDDEETGTGGGDNKTLEEENADSNIGQAFEFEDGPFVIQPSISVASELALHHSDDDPEMVIVTASTSHNGYLDGLNPKLTDIANDETQNKNDKQVVEQEEYRQGSANPVNHGKQRKKEKIARTGDVEVIRRKKDRSPPFNSSGLEVEVEAEPTAEISSLAYQTEHNPRLRLIIKEEEKKFQIQLGQALILSYRTQSEDVKDWPSVDISLSNEQQRCAGERIVTYVMPDSPTGSFNYHPYAHFRSELNWFYELHDEAEKYFIDGAPLFTANPKASRLHPIHTRAWNKLSHKGRQQLFSEKDILVYDPSFEPPPFGRDLLLSITENMTRAFTVNDHSADSFDNRKKTGNMDIIYLHSRDPKGSILDALDLPAIQNHQPHGSISTDVSAFNATVDKPYCNEHYPYPQRSMRWNMCGLQHSNSRFQIAPEGFVKYTRVTCGMQLCFIASLVDGRCFGDIDVFLPNNYNQNLPPGLRWMIEVVPVVPGSTIYINPGRPHAFVATSHAVCEGGYAYTWSTMKTTCYGIFHSFVTGRFLGTTNRHSWHSRELLRRIVMYYHMHFVENMSQADRQHHIPVLTDFNDIVNLLCLLNVIVLGHIVYNPTYEDDISQYSEHKVTLFAVGREKAQELLQFIDRNYLFKKDNREVEFRPIFVTYFVQQIRCLIRHHALSFKEFTPTGSSKCFTTETLAQTIAASFSGKAWFSRELKRQTKVGYPSSSYKWVSDEEYVVTRRDVHTTDEEFDIKFPLDLNYDFNSGDMCKLVEHLKNCI